MSDLLQGIDNVVFDFGQVLINLDYPKVIGGFSKVANKNQDEIKEMVVTAPVLQAFEVGEISPDVFRSEINTLLGTTLEDEELNNIWNSMLKDLPKWRMDLLERVNNRFNTFVLSNSNIIHEEAFDKMILETTGKPNLHAFVSKCYFSHDIGLRKPDEECYQYLIDDAGLNPESTLFLDDRLDNIEGARSVGLKTIQILNADKQLKEIFENG